MAKQWIRRFNRARQALGSAQALRWAVAWGWRGPEPLRVRVPRRLQAKIQIPRTLWARPGTSDIEVFTQIFIEREYQPLERLSGVTSVLDLGANVGYSSVYFLNMFPSARVLAVEPDPENFELLRRNLEPYGDRASIVQGGAWDSCGPLAIVRAPYRDGDAWSRQVHPAESTESEDSLPGFDIPSLMTMAGFERLSLLKVDIEGAEAVVFNASSQHWIDRIDNIAIELHDDSSFGMVSPIFWRAVLDRGFAFSKRGELVICMRRDGAS